jgi:HK97 family phage major capsid protein
MTPEEIELRRRMADAINAARALHDTAERENRSLNTDEQARYDQHMAEARDIEGRVNRGRELGEFQARGGAPADQQPGPGVAHVRDRDGGTAVPTLRGAVRELLDSPDLADARARGYRGGFSLPSLEGVSLAALIDQTSNTSGGAFQNPDRQARVPLTLPDRRFRLLELIPHGTTSDNSVEYVRDTTTDVAGNTAAETAEGQLKPETTSTFEIVNDPVRTIASWLDVTRQSIDDNEQLRTNLEQRLIYRALRRLDNQVINGDGTGVNLLGLLNRPGVLTYAPGLAEQRALSIRKARTVGEQNEVDYSVVVLNPLDMERFDLTLTSGSGEFLTGPAVRGEGPATVWGMLPVWSNAIAVPAAMLLDPNEAMIWDRQEPVIHVTDSDADKFRRNILTMLGELRAALSLFTPRAVCRVTFNGTA